MRNQTTLARRLAAPVAITCALSALAPAAPAQCWLETAEVPAPQGNTITVGQKEDLMSVGLTAGQTNWLINPPAGWIDCQAKVRYNSEPVPARVRR